MWWVGTQRQPRLFSFHVHLSLKHTTHGSDLRPVERSSRRAASARASSRHPRRHKRLVRPAISLLQKMREEILPELRIGLADWASRLHVGARTPVVGAQAKGDGTGDGGSAPSHWPAKGPARGQGGPRRCEEVTGVAGQSFKNQECRRRDGGPPGAPLEKKGARAFGDGGRGCRCFPWGGILASRAGHDRRPHSWPQLRGLRRFSHLLKAGGQDGRSRYRLERDPELPVPRPGRVEGGSCLHRGPRRHRNRRQVRERRECSATIAPRLASALPLSLPLSMCV